MVTMSATDAKQNMGALLDAAQSEPVTIRRQNRDIAVVLSVREYDRLRAMHAGLTEEGLADLLAE